MEKLRWGILGAAAIGDRAVIPALLASETAELIGIASRDAEKSRQKAEQYGLPKSYGSYEELLADPQIEAVYIPLPNHLHLPWTVKAARAGKHVLCEKPLALNAAEAQMMVDACRQAGVHLAEAFMYRHHPRTIRMKELVDSGAIGELRSIHGVFSFYNTAAEDIRFKADWGGGGLYDICCYPFSAARFITGAEPEAVTVIAQFSPAHDGVDMMATGLVEFPGGIGLTFDGGMWTHGRNRLEVAGSKGRIVLEPAFLTEPERDGFTIYTQDGERQEGPYGANAYVCQADQFARTVRGLEPAAFPAEDAVANMKLIEAALTSARTRQRVELS